MEDHVCSGSLKKKGKSKRDGKHKRKSKVADIAKENQSNWLLDKGNES
jgi:hypothetical protein